ncbi:hypothetical protein [Miltoncostaea marina]|uniref:hypothetical protein n=1 Tax=Miltoncostaea marina TaxID=2843215 RepID=UPI001C3C6215|nr:hypothetical protein [Miltoncostaea marina]
MAPRLHAALVAGALATAALAGCSDGATAPDAEAPAAGAGPAGYIAAVEALLDPPSQLAASIADAADRGVPPPATRRRLAGLTDRAGERLAAFRGLRLDDPALRRQRDRLAGAYARMLPAMARAADGLAEAERAGLRRAADPFLDALRELPSAAASPSPR